MNIPEIHRLMRNIGKRVERIEKSEMASQSAAKRYRQVTSDLPKDLRDLDEQKLKNLYRDLRYINNLPSSRLKEAKKIKSEYEENIGVPLESLSESKRKEFWDAFDDIYSLSPQLTQQYKYDIMDNLMRKTLEGQIPETIVDNMRKLYFETIKETGGEPSDDDFKILFTEKLQNI